MKGTFRSGVLFEIFLGVFQDFDHNEVVEDWVPVDWNLKPGDSFEYEAGCDISGVAEVVEVTGEIREDETDEGRVMKVKCTFRKCS